MCTVTFLPLNNTDFILTSNRDEQRSRETFLPVEYIEDGVKMVFPKDKIAGGTWIGASSKNRLVCVLNGAYKKHEKKNNYRKSRGVIAKEILKSTQIIAHIKDLDLQQVEPFTMVIVDWNEKLQLYELIWDEVKKSFKKLKNEPKIWSSSTLYSENSKGLRRKWFQEWVHSNDFNVENILQFHHSEKGDKEQTILMKRSYVETVSITSVKKEAKNITMLYEDVINSKKKELQF